MKLLHSLGVRTLDDKRKGPAASGEAFENP